MLMSVEQRALEAIARRALDFVPDGSVVGLGTGHAATAFLYALAEQVRAGLRVRGVPTSVASGNLARQLGIELTTLDDVAAIDVDVDGADEVDAHCNLIKGYGGALTREKIVAAASRRLVILVGPEKLVDQLGSHGILPVEVVPFALATCRRRLEQMGLPSETRQHEGRPYLTDNGNYILDCRIGPLDRPAELEQALRAVPGIVGTGLFLGMADVVLIERGDEVEVRERG
jgi:ribose 5-phosphate isomerase A